VARDRQRAKQRRRRHPGGGGPAAGSARARARDIGLEPTDADLDATEAPEPTKHAFPDVEEARMAEAGVPRGEAGDERSEAGEPREDDRFDAAVAEREHERPERRRRGGIVAFLGHVVDELRRVQWPDRRHVAQGTAVVLGFVVIAGSYLGLLDAIWKPLIEKIL
jgi:preprotein translocase SecE subunit